MIRAKRTPGCSGQGDGAPPPVPGCSGEGERAPADVPGRSGEGDRAPADVPRSPGEGDRAPPDLPGCTGEGDRASADVPGRSGEGDRAPADAISPKPVFSTFFRIHRRQADDAGDRQHQSSRVVVNSFHTTNIPQNRPSLRVIVSLGKHLNRIVFLKRGFSQIFVSQVVGPFFAIPEKPDSFQLSGKVDSSRLLNRLVDRQPSSGHSHGPRLFHLPSDKDNLFIRPGSAHRYILSGSHLKDGFSVNSFPPEHCIQSFCKLIAGQTCRGNPTHKRQFYPTILRNRIQPAENCLLILGNPSRGDLDPTPFFNIPSKSGCHSDDRQPGKQTPQEAHVHESHPAGKSEMHKNACGAIGTSFIL
ncbi:MAG: hypothetical protein RLZZ214_502 [Verrucomicrobiota bacterium]